MTFFDRSMLSRGVLIGAAAVLFLAIVGFTLNQRRLPVDHAQRPSSAMNVDSDGGLGDFHRYPCGNDLCARVQVNAATDEMDLPASIGRYITKLADGLRRGRVVLDPSVAHIQLMVSAFRIGAGGTSEAVPWGRVGISQAALRSTPDQRDFVRSLDLIEALQFSDDRNRQTANAYCEDPARVAVVPRFCALVHK